MICTGERKLLCCGSVFTETFTGVLLWDLLNEPPVNKIVTDANV